MPGKIEKEETTVIDNIECDFLGQSKQKLLKLTRKENVNSDFTVALLVYTTLTVSTC